MSNNLVIVESPAKAKTIEKFLGKDFTVLSSYGHIRDLSKKNFGVDVANGYQPDYLISEDKKKVVAELKKSVKQATTVWLASDEDREGEAIAWHLAEVLGLKPSETKRIVFHEITKPAILHAIENPRHIDIKLVDAQQARRILDRLVGFELSPVLWKKVKPSLSAGRVQSVAVRLIVERERSIMAFTPLSQFRVVAVFELEVNGKKELFKATLKDKIETKELATSFLESCKNFSFVVSDVQKKSLKRSPSAPFTTSTLQQEASRKLGFSVSQTMTVAQKLYEEGKITYMRTDSTNLSETALVAIEKVITENYGKEYFTKRAYKSKVKGAQEAHEAIRPTYAEKQNVSGGDTEKKLYDLIWKRTIASQMSDVLTNRTSVVIPSPMPKSPFVANGDVIVFDGFLKVYFESSDDEEENDDTPLLPEMSVGQDLTASQIRATEKYSHSEPRFTEASLVKKLEELGIGRPSTYAPTISTVLNRGYVVREDKEGVERAYVELILKAKSVKEEKKTEITGAEKRKLSPTDVGMIVTDFLTSNFTEILDFNFTAKVEEQFDDIANGLLNWREMLDAFYKPFHTMVEQTLETSVRERGERLLGKDPVTGFSVTVRIGRFGPLAQLGTPEEVEKPQFASLLVGQRIETITLEDALELFKLPRKLGEFEGKVISASIGRFGPYVSHNSKFVSLKKGEDDPFTIDLARAIQLVEEKRVSDSNKLIRAFEEDKELQILNGRWGPYIKYKKGNYKIAKNTDPLTLTYDLCKQIVEEQDKKGTKPAPKAKGRKKNE
ncbi:MAG: hypothetical protein RIS47_887 [Bacteroidota bacterium]|jgi:DNA topoisomerase-1